MSGQEAHLIYNHLPVVGAIWTTGLLLAGLVRPHPVLVRTAFISVIFVGLLALPTYFTGEPAEEVVELLPGIDEEALEAHEDLGKRALIVCLASALSATLGLRWSNRRPHTRAPLVPTLVLTLVAVGILAWAAHLGGGIHRPELQRGGEFSAGEHT